jgi:hypothetical protein
MRLSFRFSVLLPGKRNAAFKRYGERKRKISGPYFRLTSRNVEPNLDHVSESPYGSNLYIHTKSCEPHAVIKLSPWLSLVLCQVRPS